MAPLTQGTRRAVLSLFGIASLALLLAAGTPVHAQGSKFLQTLSTAGNGQSGVMFEMTASKSTRLYRFSVLLSSTSNVEIWARPNGMTAANDGQWIYLGSAANVPVGSPFATIPVDLNFLMNPGQTWGFVIWCATGGLSYSNGTGSYIYSDSYLAINTNGYGLSGSTSPTNGTTAWASWFTPRMFNGGVYYDDGIVGFNDMGVAAITSPLNSCAGTIPVKAKINNYGRNQVTSCTVHWTIDGVAQTPYTFSGLLDTLTATTRETEVTLGSINMASGVPYTIRAWTSNPNGLADTVNVNDTVQVTRMAALAGTFTVGGASPDFTTLADAATALNSFGVCGPVVLNMRNGVYNEQVTFKEITGASSTNTITLQSESGNKADVTITASGSSTAYHTILLEGTDWMRIRNLTITGTNASYGRIVSLLSGATNNVISDNNIFCATGATSSGSTPIYMYNAANTDNTFENNDLRWGYYGSYIYGISSTSLVGGTKYRNNRISDMYYYGLYMYYQDAPEVSGNVIVSNNTSMYYGMYLGYCQNALRLTHNNITATASSGTFYGMYVYYCTATPGSEGLVANNFVSAFRGSSTVYGMYVYYSNYQNIAFNTAHLRNTYSLSASLRPYYGSNNRYRNNIATNSGGGLAVDYYYGSYLGNDYNVFHTTGATLARWNGTNQSTLANLQATSLMEANSLQKAVTYRDMMNGDLHLAGASQNDVALTGLLLPEVADDIDHDPRVVPYRGADEACYILPNTVSYRFVDGENQDVSFSTIPGTVNVAINVAFPDMGFPLQVTVNFYTVPGNVLAYTTSFSATKLAGQTLAGTYQVAVPPTLQPGYYRMNVVFNTQNSCGDYINYTPGDKGLLLVGQGQEPCIVWPGDVNDDGIANYGDRAALNKYIFNANLRASWLTGPARYRADYLTNPMTYFTWEGQAGAPWQTPDGCYMDADGNGMVNNWDLLPIKVNFLRTHGGYVPKQDESSIAGTFGMTQNYPNPFNPSTTLQYAVPEKSTVKIVVTDMVGREVAVLVDGEVEAGVRTVVFDASALESGVYMARYEATGIASGITSSRIVRMTLAR